ncbi:hypothetical protein NAEGRDRAFT_78882 [Naegleria gruberi]|uniref:Uncharacterized protein n=1 Tax=Naegleria gruberi TaxID=5762 RepID=D2V7D9_NAEGR|nr:uncharacterized protein NAEGRDRAFT_78882 [Naegleria gruberi]EFC47237.1 hypothetical protein NAEGRDRAFT_78882 [Naegleria gruberi]|eukprot:XP_002679981.1 hypothetical protein NAEGRDRAFT_78882 [Naegleria gruberi strain NEG-M]
MQDNMVGLYLTKHAKSFQEYNYNLWNLFDLLHSSSVQCNLTALELKLHILSYCILEISPRTCPILYSTSTSSDEIPIEEIERSLLKIMYGKFDSDKTRIHQIYHHFHIYFDTASMGMTIRFPTLFDDQLIRIIWSKAKSMHCQNVDSSENYYFSIPTITKPQLDNDTSGESKQKRRKVDRDLSPLENWSKHLGTLCKNLEQLRVKLDYNLLEFMISKDNTCVCPLLRNCETFIQPIHYEIDENLLNHTLLFPFVSTVEWTFSDQPICNTLNMMSSRFLPKFPNLTSLKIRNFNINNTNYCSLNPFGPLIEYSKNQTVLLSSLSLNMSFSFNTTNCLRCWTKFWSNISELSSLERLEINLSLKPCENWESIEKDVLKVLTDTFGFISNPESNEKKLNLPKLKIIKLNIHNQNDEIIIDQSLIHFLLQQRYNLLSEVEIDFKVMDTDQYNQCFLFLEDEFNSGNSTISKLKLSGVTLNSDACVALGRCSSLRWLILKNVKFEGDDEEIRYCLDYLSQSKSITHLELPHCYLEEYHLEPILSNMDQLELLNLKFNNMGALLLLRHVTTSFSTDHDDYQVRNNLVHLNALNLEGNVKIKKEHIDTLLEQNENLTYVSPCNLGDFLPIPTFTWQ